jgi:hypothetical protein
MVPIVRMTVSVAGTLLLAVTLALTGPVASSGQVAVGEGETAHRGLPSQKQWREDVAREMRGSKAYVDRRVSRGAGKKLAINLDIDNSALATHYRPGHPTPKVFSFARHARRQGVALLFNTARRGAKLDKARDLLKDAGYKVTRLCGRTKAKQTIVQGKRRCRARFVDQGFTLIANVGNNRTDFKGPKNYGRAYRLPNYGGRLS